MGIWGILKRTEQNKRFHGVLIPYDTAIRAPGQHKWFYRRNVWKLYDFKKRDSAICYSDWF